MSKKILGDVSSELKHAYADAGFVYSKEYDRYIKEGYGAFLSNIDKKNAERFVEYISTSNLFGPLVEHGYVLVLGPSRPASNGVIYESSAGVFINNYEDVLTKVGKQVKTSNNDSTMNIAEGKEKSVDEIVDQAVVLATRYSTVVSHCKLGLNLGSILEVEGNKLLNFEKETLESCSNNKLFRVISALRKRSNESYDVRVALEHVVNKFTDELLKKTYGDTKVDESGKGPVLKK